MHIYIYPHTYAYAYICTRKNIHMHDTVHTLKHWYQDPQSMHKYAYTYTYTCVLTHRCTNTYTHAYMPTHGPQRHAQNEVTFLPFSRRFSYFWMGSHIIFLLSNHVCQIRRLYSNIIEPVIICNLIERNTAWETCISNQISCRCRTYNCGDNVHRVENLTRCVSTRILHLKWRCWKI